MKQYKYISQSIEGYPFGHLEPLPEVPPYSNATDAIDFQEDMQRRKLWQSSFIECSEQCSKEWEDGRIVTEGIDFKLHPFTPENKWVAIPIVNPQLNQNEKKI